MILETSLIDRSTQAVIPSKQQILPRHSHAVAVLTCWQSSTGSTNSHSNPALSNNIVHKAVYDKAPKSLIRVATQINAPPYTNVWVLVTMPASGLLVIQHHFPCLSRHKTLAALGIVDVPPRLLFYATIRAFSDVARHHPKHMVIAHTEPSSPTTYYC